MHNLLFRLLKIKKRSEGTMGCNLSKSIKVRPVVTKTEVCYHRAVAGPGSHTLTRRPSVADDASAEHEEGPAEACGEQGSSGFNLPGTSVSLLCLGGSSSAELLLLSISSTDAVPKPVKARDSSSGSEVPVQEAGTRPTLTPTLQVPN